MRRPTPCPTCGEQIALVHWADHQMWIDVEPVDNGELTLRGDHRAIPDGHFVVAFFGVGPEGDEFFGVPAGAPRYHRHSCTASR
jgi:hypothetical protein